jgi:magnesium-transporting ATPase (P-type)
MAPMGGVDRALRRMLLEQLLVRSKRDDARAIETDDHYATIVNATEQGRGIYASLRKAVMYLLSGNLGETWCC